MSARHHKSYHSQSSEVVFMVIVETRKANTSSSMFKRTVDDFRWKRWWLERVATAMTHWGFITSRSHSHRLVINSLADNSSDTFSELSFKLQTSQHEISYLSQTNKTLKMPSVRWMNPYLRSSRTKFQHMSTGFVSVFYFFTLFATFLASFFHSGVKSSRKILEIPLHSYPLHLIKFTEIVHQHSVPSIASKAEWSKSIKRNK